MPMGSSANGFKCQWVCGAEEAEGVRGAEGVCWDARIALFLPIALWFFVYKGEKGRMSVSHTDAPLFCDH